MVMFVIQPLKSRVSDELKFVYHFKKIKFPLKASASTLLHSCALKLNDQLYIFGGTGPSIRQVSV